MKDSESDRIPTNLRLLMILEAFADLPEAATASEIGRLVGLPKQTAHRLCQTLLNEGYVVRAERGGGYRPARRARAMATAILHGPTSSIERRQVLQALAEEIGETVNFVVPEDGGMSYVDRVETNWAFRIQLPIGTNVPFHCTASGKAFLSTLPKKQRQRMVGVMHLERLTERTKVDPDALLDDLGRIAKRGYALDNQEFMDGMVAAAVPVRDGAGRYFASLAFHGPVQRISVDQAIETVPTLTEAAERITRTLF